MAQRTVHYESAFEHFLRLNRIPYVAVDEAKKTLLRPKAGPAGHALTDPSLGSAKSFDFLVTAEASKWLVDVKGRRLPLSRRHESRSRAPASRPMRLESWVTQADVDAMNRWGRVFGDGFEAVFVFVYWCSAQPPDSLFEDVFHHRGRWYAMRAVKVDHYQRVMTTRSPSWMTLHVAADQFDRISRPVRQMLEK
ncbi:MAG: hypothetical protein D8M59_07835 [Planctomycetes bacterium]|nr:hypothetical protein [Planctomycetota bacterium]NOG53234.1 HYExAFE family protein [Planctomycetota bacterium]